MSPNPIEEVLLKLHLYTISFRSSHRKCLFLYESNFKLLEKALMLLLGIYYLDEHKPPKQKIDKALWD